MASRGSKVFIIGGRRGFGKSIVEQWRTIHPQDVLVVSSRSKNADYLFDVSREVDVSALLIALDTEKPERVICVAGGGPYGPFMEKEWKDHVWALNVTLLAPMRLLHHCLRATYCEQIVVVGSAIAENEADKGAASYCSAKHGLLGLCKTVVLESSKDIRLFSPGYMATDMLPVKSASIKAKTVYNPLEAAKELVQWALISKSTLPEGAWHKTYTP